MNNLTFAAIFNMAYGFLCIFGIAKALVYTHERKRNAMLIITIILGIIGCIYTIPTYVNGLVYTGIRKYILGITCGIIVAFVPLVIVDFIIIKIQDIHKRYIDKKKFEQLYK